MNNFPLSLPASARSEFQASTGGMRAAAGLVAIALVGLQALGLATQDGSQAAPVACLPVVELPTVEIRGQRQPDSPALASASDTRGDAAVKLAF